MPIPSESEVRPNRAEIISIATLAERDLEAFLAECRAEFGTAAALSRGCAVYDLEVHPRTARKWLARGREPGAINMFAVRRIIALRRNARDRSSAVAEVARLERQVAEARASLAGLEFA